MEEEISSVTAFTLKDNGQSQQNTPLETSSRPALGPTNLLSNGYLLRIHKALHPLPPYVSHVQCWAERNFHFSSKKRMFLTIHSLFDKQ